MKVIHKHNLKVQDVVGIKGAGKASVVLRAGDSQYGYTNSLKRTGSDYDVESYRVIDEAVEVDRNILADSQARLAKLLEEQDAIDARIRSLQSQMRYLVLSMPLLDEKKLPKLEPIKETKHEIFTELREANAPYIPYGCTLFRLDKQARIA